MTYITNPNSPTHASNTITEVQSPTAFRSLPNKELQPTPGAASILVDAQNDVQALVDLRASIAAQRELRNSKSHVLFQNNAQQQSGTALPINTTLNK